MRIPDCNGSKPRARAWCLPMSLVASVLACSGPAETPPDSNQANIGGATQGEDDDETSTEGGQDSTSGASTTKTSDGSGGANHSSSSLAKSVGGSSGAGGNPASSSRARTTALGGQSDGGAANSVTGDVRAGDTGKGGRSSTESRSSVGGRGPGSVRSTGGGGASASRSSLQLGGKAATGGAKASAGTLAIGGTAQSSSTSTGDACPNVGHVTYSLAQASTPTAEQRAAYAKITAAMDTAVRYYNCYTDITKTINVSFVPSVQTADGNINGSIRFGSTASMNHVTAMHEISHTVGVGTAPKWASMISNGLFTGANAKAEVALQFSDSEGVVHADTQHFWPGGLNYESEGKNESDLIAHCRMVAAIRKDLGLN